MFRGQSIQPFIPAWNSTIFPSLSLYLFSLYYFSFTTALAILPQCPLTLRHLILPFPFHSNFPNITNRTRNLTQPENMSSLPRQAPKMTRGAVQTRLTYNLPVIWEFLLMTL